MQRENSDYRRLWSAAIEPGKMEKIRKFGFPFILGILLLAVLFSAMNMVLASTSKETGSITNAR